MYQKLDTFFVALYTIVDDLYQEQFSDAMKRKPGVKPKFADSEVITLSLARELLSFASERCFLGFVRTNMSHLFPNAVEQSQFNRRTRYLHLAINHLRRKLLDKIGAGLEAYRVIDTTDVPVVEFGRACSTTLFKGEAAYGHSSSKKATHYGFKLFVMATLEGMPLDFGLFPANTDDQVTADDVLDFHRDIIVIADKGFLDKDRALSLKKERNITMLSLKRANQKLYDKKENKLLSSFRQIIETVNELLKDHFNLEKHLARTLEGLKTRIVTKITGLTIGIYMNKLFGFNALALRCLVF
ncbi:MAG TPA: IS982 family transposase [Anaerolineae bacterium]|nr:IS982 family transposase [Anaerolineae bacterium]